MAFQAGTPVDPRLMQADYSGFTNAANIRANALANLGQQIGEGIEKYQKNKEITATTLASVEGSVAANPQYLETALAQGGKIAKAAQKLQDGDVNRMDLLTLEGYFSTLTKVSQAKAEAEDARLQRENLIARTGASERSNRSTESPISASTLSGITNAMTEAGVGFDTGTGQFYKKDYGNRMNPFDNKKIPIDFPIKGAEEYREIYSDPGVITFNPDEYKLLSTQ